MKKIILNDENAIGMLYFIPNDEFAEGVPCKGHIKERYQEGSVYEGEGEYDGKNFYRQGNGVQEFSHSAMNGEHIGGPAYSKIYKFVGEYDRHASAWMYGNGIFYFVDQNDKPIAFTKGFFQCTTKIDEWHGDFDYDTILQGFTKEMECELIPFKGAHDRLVTEHQGKTCDYLFFGDSWVEQWRDLKRFDYARFYKDTADINALNVGIGGTKYSDWANWLDDLVIPFAPKKIFINLGFNDLHHGQKVNEVYDNFKTVVEGIKKALPEVKIYINSVTHCSVFDDFFEKEVELNNLLIDYCAKMPNMCYIPVNKEFMSNGKRFEDMDDYCIEDNLHLNERGYKIWSPFVLNYVKNK